MDLHCAHGDAEFVGYLLVLIALGDEMQYLFLSRSQRLVDALQLSAFGNFGRVTQCLGDRLGQASAIRGLLKKSTAPDLSASTASGTSP